MAEGTGNHRIATVARQWLRLSGPALGLVSVFVLCIILLGIKGRLANFLGPQNLQVLLHQSAVPAVAALGMLLIIISGGIDLSVGSVVALVTVVTMQTFRILEARTGSQAIASLGAILAGLTTGGACGLANGLVVTKLRLTPFVATLGMLSIARGLAVWISDRQRVSFAEQRPGWVDALAQARAGWMLVDPGVWSVLLLALVVAVFLRWTVLGRYCYAIGSNEGTARLCGVPVDRVKVALYGLAGLLTGWAGILVFAHGNSGDPNAGVGLELDVIAAVVIGGAALSGGQGNVPGALLGVLILNVLENGVSSFGVPIEVKHILIGGIIIANTAISRWQRQSATQA